MKSKSMINKGMTSSEHDDWGTPQDFFDELDKEFHFDVDVCAFSHNAKCKDYFTPEQDGLKQNWDGNKVYWMNPPYGRQIGKWVKKAHESAQNGATVVCLLPSRTDTAWWHDYCMKGEVRFIKGRLYFEKQGKNDRAPFPSAVVVFK